MSSCGTGAAIATLKQDLARHPADRDTLQALVSLSRGAGDFATALEYAEQLARGSHSPVSSGPTMHLPSYSTRPS